jgi:hypothetical protein
MPQQLRKLLEEAAAAHAEARQARRNTPQRQECYERMAHALATAYREYPEKFRIWRRHEFFVVVSKFGFPSSRRGIKSIRLMVHKRWLRDNPDFRDVFDVWSYAPIVHDQRRLDPSTWHGVMPWPQDRKSQPAPRIAPHKVSRRRGYRLVAA